MISSVRTEKKGRYTSIGYLGSSIKSIRNDYRRSLARTNFRQIDGYNNLTLFASLSRRTVQLQSYKYPPLSLEKEKTKKISPKKTKKNF